MNNGGKCGICGDPWQNKIRDNEAGGKYANGIITRTYMEGQVRMEALETPYFSSSTDRPIMHCPVITQNVMFMFP